MPVSVDDHFHIHQMTFDGLPAWRNDRFETERFANRVLSCVGFADLELSGGPAEKIEPHLPLIFLKCVGNSGFTRLEC